MRRKCAEGGSQAFVEALVDRQGRSKLEQDLRDFCVQSMKDACNEQLKVRADACQLVLELGNIIKPLVDYANEIADQLQSLRQDHILYTNDKAAQTLDPDTFQTVYDVITRV